MESLYWPYICILTAVLMLIFLILNLKSMVYELMKRVKILEDFSADQMKLNDSQKDEYHNLIQNQNDIQEMNYKIIEHAEKVIHSYENFVEKVPETIDTPAKKK